jgi:hypothetical protein
VRALWVVGVLGLPAIGAARGVFLNGVSIDAVRDQVFPNARVEIDAHGNIHITAKGFAVRQGADRVEGSEVPLVRAGEPTTRRFFLVTEKAAIDQTAYAIDVYVNDKWVRKLLDEEEQVVFELTRYLTQGANQIRFVAKKNPRLASHSREAAHYFRVIVGEGEAGGKNVVVRKKLIEYQRDASEQEDFTHAYTLTAY